MLKVFIYSGKTALFPTAGTKVISRWLSVAQQKCAHLANKWWRKWR